jgi:hypothetical protein
MTGVWLALVLLLIFALSGGVVTPDPVKVFAFQTATSVGIGGAEFSRTTITEQSGCASLRVSVATGTSVPNGATATVEVSESSNFDSVSYVVSPARTQTVVLGGGGISTIVVFTLCASPGNQDRGTVVNRATIVDVTNATVGTPAFEDDLKVTVAGDEQGGDVEADSSD